MAESENRFERAQALSAAFDPIIDICLRLGVNVSELESLLRVQFVKRLAEVLPKNSRTGNTPSHEQVALAAGLNRKEVQRIRGRGGAKSAQQRMRKKSEAHSKSQRVIDMWRKDSRFLNNSGGPLALPVARVFTDGPSFEELVAKALPHRRHGLVLEDLRRRGVIQVTDEIVRLRRVAQPLPTELNTQSLDYLAAQMRQVGDTLLKAIENPAGDGTSLALFAASEAVRIPADQVAAVRAAIQEQVANFLQGFARDQGRKPKSKRAKDKTVAITANVYIVPER